MQCCSLIWVVIIFSKFQMAFKCLSATSKLVIKKKKKARPFMVLIGHDVDTYLLTFSSLLLLSFKFNTLEA